MADLPEPPRTAAELAALLRPLLPQWTFGECPLRGLTYRDDDRHISGVARPGYLAFRLISDLALQLAECRRLRAETGDGPEVSEDDAARTLR